MAMLHIAVTLAPSQPSRDDSVFPARARGGGRVARHFVRLNSEPRISRAKRVGGPEKTKNSGRVSGSPHDQQMAVGVLVVVVVIARLPGGAVVAGRFPATYGFSERVLPPRPDALRPALVGVLGE
ncbi:hypothetical protein OsI_20675 [Oryza sativa Indica Group]|uniref:Uncharacterized protein n=1 Tax=Oryza sativa subsp. indica TaxID=39946 RepID=B8B021_ORYSI|nr:hypothetical protein OsI_20675 [Oryza sativa Indica Group]